MFETGHPTTQADGTWLAAIGGVVVATISFVLGPLLNRKISDRAKQKEREQKYERIDDRGEKKDAAEVRVAEISAQERLTETLLQRISHLESQLDAKNNQQIYLDQKFRDVLDMIDIIVANQDQDQKILIAVHGLLKAMQAAQSLHTITQSPTQSPTQPSGPSVPQPSAISSISPAIPQLPPVSNS